MISTLFKICSVQGGTRIDLDQIDKGDIKENCDYSEIQPYDDLVEIKCKKNSISSKCDYIPIYDLNTCKDCDEFPK